MQDGINKIYAVDVAFRESGLNYGGTDGTVQRIIKKCLRNAMCVYGYLDCKDAEIIFASPRISKSILEKLIICIDDMKVIMSNLGFCFRFRVFANSDFQNKVLSPILKVSGGIADTNELFMRSYQMLQMYKDSSTPKEVSNEAYAELKIGKVVQLVLSPLLESGCISTDEIVKLQSKEYSNKILGLHFPLLIPVDSEYNKVRYYKNPVRINGVDYKLCSQWAEGQSRNHLMSFIESHRQQVNEELANFISEHNLCEVDFLGEVAGHRYYIEKMPENEDADEATMIMVYGQESYICNYDEKRAVIGLFSGDATIDKNDSHSIGTWKRIFNVSESDLLKVMEDVGNSAVAVKAFYSVNRAVS